MKKILFTLLMALVAMTITAKDWKTVVVTTNPQMHCENCENKIKGNLKFVKGIKDVQTSVAEQKVTIQYNEKQTNEEAILKAFKKFGYTATVVNCCSKAESGCAKAEGCPNAEQSACCKKAETGCPKAESGCSKAEAGCSKPEGACQKTESGCCGKCEKAQK